MRHCPVCSMVFDDAAEVCPHDGVALVAEDPLVGRVIDGKYRVDQRLGSGAMGAVYRATQLALKRPVAIKVIVPHAAGKPAYAKRFEREAVAVARLKHPHIVAVHDYGVASGVGAYLVMEFVEGDTLRAEIHRRHRLPLLEAVPWMREICSAVHTAHTAGVVHRDLKPDNIILERTADGRIVKVLDFGIARFVEESVNRSPSLTQSGAIIGTPLYMSPEQCKGEPAGAASDIYSLGCIFYEMLAGQPPFIAQETPAILYRHVSVPPIPPSRLVPEIPPAIEEAILRALAKRPEERFATAADLQRALSPSESPTLHFVTGTDEPAVAPLSATVAALPATDPSPAPNNLPRSPSSFVGRGRDVEALKRALARHSVVTVTGIGGIGKTRLATRVASDLLESFADGVWLVELAAVTDPALVPAAVATAAGVHEEPTRSLERSLVRALRDKRVLLVLDNCEHLVEACAAVADEISRACPEARVLATSREPLGVDGERVWPLAPLALPKLDAPLVPHDLAASDAVALLLDRAKMSKPSFALTASNAAAVVELCRRLDGIPLAIELAAARVKALSVPQILAKLDEGLRILSGGARTALPRHQTLRAAIDWSHDLLDERERALLRRASIFARGWSLEAAEAACTSDDLDEYEVLDTLSRLVDKSLVTAEDRGDETRYAMPQVIRQYAREKLREAGEEPRLAAAHHAFFLRYAEETAQLFASGDHEEWRRRMGDEASNVHAALEYGGAPEESLRLSVALGAYWDMFGQWSKGRTWLERCLAAAPDADPFVRARALFRAGSLAHRQGDITIARDQLQRSLALLRGTGHDRMIADVLSQLGLIANKLGENDQAHDLLTEALDLHRREGPLISTASTLQQLGLLEHDRGDTGRAYAYFEESESLFESAGFEQGIALARCEVAQIEQARGDFARAEHLLDQVLSIARANGYDFLVVQANITRGEILTERGDLDGAQRLCATALDTAARLGAIEDVARAIEALARVASARNDAPRALKLAGAAERLREAMHEPMRPAARAALEEALAGARRTVGDDAARFAVEAGRAMTLDRAVGFALGASETATAHEG
jgi:predicted ATPase/serine/threonine protein kinase